MELHQLKFNQRDPFVDELPPLIFIETFWGCNLRCGFCPVPGLSTSPDGRRPRAMSMEVFSSIMEQISDKPREINLNMMGEATLNPLLPEFIRLAKHHDHKVSLYTNGTRLDSHLAREIIDSRLDVLAISFDGASKNVYEQLRIGASFEDVYRNVVSFDELNRNAGKPVYVSVDCIDSDVTHATLKQHNEMFSPFCDNVRVIPLGNWAGQNTFFDEHATNPVREQHHEGERYPCHLLWDSMAISAEGRLQLCCHDYKLTSELPDTRDVTLKEAYCGALLRWRIAHTAGHYPGVCKECQWWLLPETI